MAPPNYLDITASLSERFVGAKADYKDINTWGVTTLDLREAMREIGTAKPQAPARDERIITELFPSARPSTKTPLQQQRQDLGLAYLGSRAETIMLHVTQQGQTAWGHSVYHPVESRPFCSARDLIGRAALRANFLNQSHRGLDFMVWCLPALNGAGVSPTNQPA